MKRLGLLLALLPALALAQDAYVLPAGGLDGESILSSPSELGRYFWSDGSGANSVVDPCTAFSSDLTSPSFCLRGDGTSTGSLTLSAVGSPTTQTMPWCENGLSCGSVSRQLVSASAYYQTASMAQPSGSWWACVRGIVDAPLPAAGRYMGQTGAWTIQSTSTGALSSIITGGTTITSSAGLVVGGSSQLACLWWHQVASGSNVATLYLDGVQVATNSTEANLASVSASVFVGQQGGNPISRLGFAMFGTGDPSSTLFARLAAATAPTPQGTRGEAVSTTRASASWVSASDGSLTVLQNNRLGVSGGVVSSPSRTNLLLDSEQLDAAAWVVNGTVDTATGKNAVVAPDGSQTADTINGTAAGTVNFLKQTFTANGGGYAISGWGKAGTSTAGELRIFDTTSSTELCHSASPTTSTLVRLSCSVSTTTSGHTIIAALYPAGIALGATGSSTWVDLQLETGSVASAYCRSEGTSSTCAGDQVTVPTPSGLSTKEGCAKVCVTSTFTGANPSASAIYFLNGNSANTSRFLWLAGGGSSLAIFDGTSNAFASGSLTAGTKTCFASRWSASGNFKRVDNLTSGVNGTPTTFTSLGTFDATIQIGGSGTGSQPLGSTISDIQFGASAGACQ